MPRILIIGGGIGGLTAAIALRASGFHVAVFERAPDLREVGAGLTLWTNATRCLRTLGIGPAIESQGNALAETEIRSWSGKLIVANQMQMLSDKLGAPTIGIHRADLQRTLADALPAGTLHLDASCLGYTADASGVTANFGDGRQERGDLLIGADGIRSRIRAQLHGDQEPRYAGYTAWRGIGRIDHPAVPCHVTMLAMGRGSQFGIVPIGQGRTYWFATMNTPAGGKDPEGRCKQFLLDRYREWYAPVPATIEATEADAILRNDIIDRPPIENWVDGRVTLLGDAAHPMTPNLGQGACQAIEDAIVLTHCLTGCKDLAAALRTYEQRRYERTAMITKQSWQIGRVLGWESRFWCGVRDRLFSLLAGRMLRQTEKIIGAGPV